MGIVTMGVPVERALLLKRLGHYEDFIETGTFQGGTSAWAAGIFARVQTIEASPELHATARDRLATHANVVTHLGTSQDVLRTIVPALRGPALFWLDAHWSGGATFGASQECPLLQELAIVLGSGKQHAVLIDDARCFLCPPPRPHDWRQWPGIEAICTTVRAQTQGGYFVTVLEDVIYCLPKTMEADWCNHIADTGAKLPPAPGGGWIGLLARGWRQLGRLTGRRPPH